MTKKGNQQTIAMIKYICDNIERDLKFINHMMVNDNTKERAKLFGEFVAVGESFAKSQDDLKVAEATKPIAKQSVILLETFIDINLISRASNKLFQTVSRIE
jgi:glycogen debranching enzyme